MTQQMSKVERRKEEMKKIQKGIYQTQVMIDSEAMETLIKECERNNEKNEGTKTEGEKEASGEKDQRIVDIKAEMEKMMSMSKPMV